jgi:hypothetical protein
MIFNTFVEDSDMEWVMIDAIIIRTHQHSSGVKEGKESGIRAFLGGSARFKQHVMLMVIRYGSF